MKTDLGAIAFDHYQRYASSACLLEALGDDVATVLEVGANRQRLFEYFLPRAQFVFSDIAPLPEMGADFVQADATALPFGNGEFDAVVCLDVVEHMPRAVRPRAIAEIARVSRRMVVVAFPADKPWVHEAEARANGYWKQYFGGEYPWLEEHKEFGLVDGDEIETALHDAGMRVLRFGHADVGVWAGLMGAHFIKERLPELQQLVAAADRFYNTSVFLGDHGDTCYREFFVGVRDEADIERVRGVSMLAARRDEPASALLAGLAEVLQPIADRTLRAEAGWSETADYARKVSEEWRSAAADVREMEAALDTARGEWAATAERVRVLESHANDLESHARDLESHASNLESHASNLESRVSDLTEQLRAASTELSLERTENVQLRHRQRRLIQATLVTAVVIVVVAACWYLTG